MNICKNCGNELRDGSVYCDKCGKKVLTDIPLQGKCLIGKFRFLKSKKTTIIIPIVVALIICAFFFIFYINDPIFVCKNAIKNNNYYKAVSVYNEDIKGNKDKENRVKELLLDEINNIKSQVQISV